MLSSISLSKDAVQHNYRVFCALLGKERVAPVVKSNAYGHGLSQFYQMLAELNPHWLCVNYVDEAESLRKLGFTGRILVCGPVTPDLLARLKSVDADFFVGTWETLNACFPLGGLKIHLEFDTGMSRLGFNPSRVEELVQCVAANRSMICGLAMHFANVEDVTDQAYAKRQLAIYSEVVNAFESYGLKGLMKHTAASAPAMLLDESRFDLCRVGISSYGLWPSQITKVSFLQHSQKMIELRPVLEWKTKLVQLTPINSGQYVGYGCTFRARHPMLIGVIPVGYYEGYPRAAGSNGAFVLIRGERCPIVGRICMNMIMVDVTDIQDAHIGEEVVLIGRSGGDVVSCDDVANWSQTINYEIVSRIHPDIPRIIQ